MASTALVYSKQGYQNKFQHSNGCRFLNETAIVVVVSLYLFAQI
jgi:hypothetical protein